MLLKITITRFPVSEAWLTILSRDIYSEVFTGPEKRRKRGSLFSRKKKDKLKSKGQSTNCDGELDTQRSAFPPVDAILFRYSMRSGD